MKLFSSQNRVRTLVNLGQRRHKMLIVAGVNSAAASVISASPLLSPPASYIFCPLPPGNLSFQNLSLGLEGCDEVFFCFFSCKKKKKNHHGLGMFRELVVLTGYRSSHCDNRKPQKQTNKKNNAGSAKVKEEFICPGGTRVIAGKNQISSIGLWILETAVQHTSRNMFISC